MVLCCEGLYNVVVPKSSNLILVMYTVQRNAYFYVFKFIYHLIFRNLQQHTTTWKFILGRHVCHVGSQQVAYAFSLSFI